MVGHTTEEGFRNLHSFFLRALKIPTLARFPKISPLSFNSSLFSATDPSLVFSEQWLLVSLSSPRFQNLLLLKEFVPTRWKTTWSRPICLMGHPTSMFLTSNNSYVSLSMNSCTLFPQNRFFFFKLLLFSSITLLILDNFFWM